MGLSIKAIIVVIGYAIISNFVIVQIANLNIGVNCPQVVAEYSASDLNYTSDDGGAVTFRANVIDVATNRCSGLPGWVYWAFEVPVLIGLLYIVRGFIGAT